MIKGRFLNSYSVKAHFLNLQGGVRLLILGFFTLFLLLYPSIVHADLPDPQSAADIPAIMEAITQKEATLQPQSVILPPADMKIMASDDVFSVSVTVPLAAVSDDNSVEPEHLSIATNFYRQSSSVDKRVFIDAPGSKYMFNARMNRPLGAQPFTNEVIEKDHRSWLVYDNGTDVIAYNLSPDPAGGVAQKEWIYARAPNSPEGSRYDWTFETMGRRVQLKEMPDGRVGLHHDILINGMDNEDETERQRLLGVVRMALPEAYIVESPLTAIFEPVVFWTSDGVPREGKYVLTSRNTLTVAVQAHPREYPLLIDPTINYGAWLGGDEGKDATVRAMAVDVEEIYAGGDVAGHITVGGTVAGTYSSKYEGYVLKISDGSPPAVNWLQWLGGSSLDSVYSLAVSGDEVYAGGYSDSSASLETVGATAGTYNESSVEGWVVEIADGSPPSLAWWQWLGGSAADYVYALAVNGDEIYAGGFSFSFTSWETVGATAGTYNASATEAWVVEISDSSPPTVNWLQWLGGSSSDSFSVLAVNGDEIYAGGYSISFTSWETVGSTAGTFNASSYEGWVVEIADGIPPILAWRQWLGGSSSDHVNALAVNADEIYTGGYTDSFTSWETVGATAGTYNASSSEAWVVEIADGNPPTLAWRQWLGGSSTDYIYSLAVNGDEIYAGGYSFSFTSWETAAATAGTYNVSVWQGWVVEITDGSPPTVDWRHWLGGDGNVYFQALAINGDEIYSGGYSSLIHSSWETFASVNGNAYAGVNSGFIIELGDGSPPTANWLQWLGGDSLGDLKIQSLAVTSDEIYAGGSAGASSWAGTVLKAGTYNVGNGEGWVGEIADGITPALVWVQWLGGNKYDYVNALAVNGDEIYAGGYSESFSSWETVGATAGTYNNSYLEAWVVEIADGSPPTLAWRQWLGGGGDEYMYALAVNGDEIYAGGYSESFTSWETAGATAGTYVDWSYEGWAVEIADGSPPTLAWRHWLGSYDGTIKGLAVNGDEIYAGGYSFDFDEWETAGATAGTHNVGSYESWVVEIADGSPPTLTWLHLLGGGHEDYLNALAVNGDEIYAGGYSGSFTSWETAGSIVGTYNDSADEAWVVEIADGSPPSLAWLQWLGGSANDRLYALAVNGDEIYAGGYSISFTSWDTVSATSGTFNGLVQESWVVEITDGSPPTLGFVQWLGGDGENNVYALAVNADEIYAGGTLTIAASFEVTLPDNSYDPVGFYVEIADDIPPVTTLYWVGDTSTAWALAANWSESSGGADAAAYPTAGHTAVFDGNSAGNCAISASTSIDTLRITSGFTRTLTLTSAFTTANDFTVDGTGVFNFAGATTVDIQGSLAFLGGTLTAPSAIMSVAKSLTIDGDTEFIHNNGTLVFDGSSAGQTIITSDNTLYNLMFTDAGSWTLSGGMTIANDITLSSGTLNAGSSLLQVQGDWLNNGGTFTPSTSTVMMNGTSTQNLTCNTQAFNNLTINDGLVGYWKLDETGADTCSGGVNDACDSSGFSNDAAAYFSVVASTTVPVLNFADPGSVTLDGSSYLRASRSAVLEPSHPTVSAWVKGGAQGTFKYITGKLRISEDTSSYALYTEGTGGLRFYIVDTGNNVVKSADYGPGIWDNSWHYIAGTFDGTDLRLYVDGVLVGAPAATGSTISYTAEDFYIGSHNASSSYNFNGLIDDIRVYNRALSAAEIARLAAGNQPNTGLGTVTLSGGLDVNGTLTLAAGTLDTNGADITVAGSWLNYGGILTEGTRTVTLDGTSGAHRLQGGNDAFYNLTINGAGGAWALQDDISVNSAGTLTLTAGTITQDTTLSIAGGTVTLNGAAYTGSAIPLLVDADFNLSSGTFSAPSSALIVDGAFNKIGATFTHNSGTVTFTSDAARTITTSGTTTFNNVVVNTGSGLIGYWKFDETSGTSLADASGYGNTATMVNGPAFVRPGVNLSFTNTSAITFDGSDDYVSLSNLAVDTGAGKKNTVSFWMLWTGSTTQMPFGWGSSSYDLYFASSCFGFNTGEGNVLGVSNSGLANKWKHIAATFYNGVPDVLNNELYIDGVKQSLYACAGTTTGSRSATQTALISGWGSSSTYKFKGMIDDFRMYKRALSQGEVNALYYGYEMIRTPQTFTPSGALDINGTLTLAGGSFNLDTNDPAVNIAGNIMIAPQASITKSSAGALVTFDGDLTYLDYSGGANFGRVTIGASPDMTTLASDFTVDSLTITASDTLVTNGYEVDINGPVIINGTFNAASGTDGASVITISGDWTMNGGGDFIETNATVTFDGTGSQNVTSNSETYYALTAGNTSSGGVNFLDAFTTSYLLSQTADSVMRFQNNTAFIITNALTLSGGALGDELDINTIGEDAGNFSFTLSASATMAYADMSHMNITDTGAGDYDLTAYYSINGGNNNTDGFGNDDVLFDAATEIKTLFWVGDTSTAWTTPANWSTASGGPDVTVYPVTGYTAVFDANSAGDCTISAATSIDVVRITSGFARTFTLSSSLTTARDLYFDGTGSFDVSGALTIDVQGSLALTGGYFTAPAVMSVGQSFTIDGDATFRHANGTLVFDGSSAGSTILSSDDTLYNVFFTGPGSWTLSGGMTIANDITLSSGTLNAGSSLLQVQGDWLNNGGTFTPSTSTVMMSGTSTQTLTSNSQAFNNLAINDGLVGYWKLDETGTLALDSSGHDHHATWVGANLSSSLDVPNVNFFDNRSLLTNTNGQGLRTSGISRFHASTFTIAAWAKRISGAVLLADENNISGACGQATGWGGWYLEYSRFTYCSSAEVQTHVNFSKQIAPSWTHVAVIYDTLGSTIAVYYDGILNVSAVPAGMYFYSVTPRISIGAQGNLGNFFNGYIDDVRYYDRVLTSTEIARLAAGNQPNTGLGTVTLSGGLDVNGTLTLAAGTLDTNGSDITVAGSWLNYGGILTEGTRTVTLDGTSGAHRLQGGNDAFYNLTINGAGGTWALQDDISVNSAGTLTLTAGTITQDTTLSIAGGTVTLNGATYTGSALPLLVDADLNLSSGTFTAPGSALIVDGAFNKTGATFTHNSGTVNFASNAARTITTSATTTFNNMVVNAGSGLIGYWKFDETSGTSLADASGYGNTATMVNGPAFVRPGVNLSFTNTSAITFDGSDDYVSLSNLAVDTGAGKKNTVSFWMLWTGITGGMPFGWGSSAYDLIFNSTCFGFNTGESGNVFGSTSAGLANKWKHVAATFYNGVPDNLNNELYIDGVKQSLYACTGTTSGSRSATQTALISGWGSNSSNKFKGMIDDFRMFKRALSQGEVDALYYGYEMLRTPQTYTPSGALDINGTLTLAGGSFNLDTHDPTVNIAGNIMLAPQASLTKASTGAMVTFDGDLTYLDYSGGANFGRVTIGSSPDMTTLASDFTVDSLTIAASDTLVTDGYEMNVNGPVIINGLFNAASGTDGASVITVAGDWTINSGGAFTKTGSTVVFDATSALGSDASFNNMAVSGALTTGARMISIEGTFTAAGGTFTAANSTVTFTGSGDQTITLGGNNFHNLVLANTGGASGLGLLFTDGWSAANLKAVTANTILRFQNNTAYTITGDLTMNGGALGNELDLDTIGEDAGNFAFTLASSETIKYAYITHMNVTDTGAGDYDLTAYNSANGGSNNTDGLGNDDLLFDAATALATLYWVGDTSTAWNNAANWSVTSGGADAGTYPQTGFTAIFDGNSTGNCAISTSTSIDTLRINAGFVRSLTLTSSFTIANDITMNGGTFTSSGAATLDINGAFALMDGTFTAPTQVLSISKNFTIDSDATFTPSGGTVVLDGTTAQTITSNARTLYNLQITNSAAAIIFTDAFTANSLQAQTGGSSLKFQNGTTYTFTGALTLDGVSGNTITINTDDGSGANLDFSLPATDTLLSYINLNRLNVSANSLYCSNCVDGANNNSDGTGGDDVVFTPYCLGASGDGDDNFAVTDDTQDVILVYSAADQTFTVGDASSVMSDLTIVYESPGVGSGGINSADDLRVVIPSANMSWDQADNSAAVSGSAVAGGRISATPTVSFEGDATIVVPVLGTFLPDDIITIGQLSFKNFLDTLYDSLAIKVAGAAASSAADDQKLKVIRLSDTAVLLTGASGRGDDSFAYDETLTLFWVGRTSTSWIAPENWSGISGGPDASTYPGVYYTAIFDANSADNCVISAAASIDTLRLDTGFVRTLTLTSAFTIANDITMNGGTFTGSGAATLDINGALALMDGTFTAPAQVLSLSKNFTIDSDATFTPSGGTVVFDGTTAQTITSNAQTLHDLQITNSAAAITFTDAFTANSLQAQTGGSSLKFQNGTTYTLTGALTLDGVYGSEISINTDDGLGTNVNFALPAAETLLTYINVNRLNVSANSAYCADCTDAGNNNSDGTGGDDVIFTPYTFSANGLGDDMSLATDSTTDLILAFSAADQSFVVGDVSTAMNDLTIILEALGEGSDGINTTDDMRVVIPYNAMHWDQSDSTAAVFGSAVDGGRMSGTPTVSFEGDTTIVIPVLGTFTDGDMITVSGLNFTSFSDLLVGHLNIVVDGAFAGSAAEDLAWKIVNQLDAAVAFTSGNGQGDDVYTFDTSAAANALFFGTGF